MTENDEKKYKLSLSLATAAITIIAPLLYSFGYMYDQGYLNQFGLSGEFFTKSIQEYLFIFFFIFVQTVLGVFSIPFKYLLFLVGYALLVPMTVFLMTNKHIRKLIEKFKMKRIKTLKENSATFIGLVTAYTFFWIGKIVFTVLFIAFTLVLAGLEPFNMGQETAAKSIDNFVPCDIENEAPPTDCVYLYKGEIEILSGILIAKSDSQIGVWDGDKTIVYPLNGETIVIQKAKKKPVKKVIK